MGNVAKTQLKGQQGNQHTAPLSDQIDKSKDLKVNRVKQAEKAEKGRVNPDAEKEKKRRRRRRKRAAPNLAGVEDSENGTEMEDPDEALSDIGLHVDTRA